MKTKRLDNERPIPKTLYLESVLRPLLELFSVSDDVFTEHDAFAPSQIHHSLGRLYRSWLDTRETLDPEFNREKYRHEMKSFQKKGTTPLGRKQRAKGQRTSSTERISTSEKSQRRTASSASGKRSKSARPVRSNSSACGGQSRTQSLSACGVEWLIASGSASASGSRTKASAKFRNGQG